MHNDVKQYFRGSNVHCESCSHERIQYFGSNTDMCSDVAGAVEYRLGRHVSDFGSSSRSRSFTISRTTSTTGRHRGFERDFNSHFVFRWCYIIMHKVYYIIVNVSLTFVYPMTPCIVPALRNLW